MAKAKVTYPKENWVNGAVNEDTQRIRSKEVNDVLDAIQRGELGIETEDIDLPVTEDTSPASTTNYQIGVKTQVHSDKRVFYSLKPDAGGYSPVFYPAKDGDTLVANAVNLVESSFMLNSPNSYVHLNLPLTAAVGDTFLIFFSKDTSWAIKCNAGQTLKFGANTTTSGGKVKTGTFEYRAYHLKLLCTVADTTFQIIEITDTSLLLYE